MSGSLTRLTHYGLGGRIPPLPERFSPHCRFAQRPVSTCRLTWRSILP